MNIRQAQRIISHLERYEAWRDKEPGRRGEVYPPGVPRDSKELIRLLKDSVALERFKRRRRS